jgi:hypothetical protein
MFSKFVTLERGYDIPIIKTKNAPESSLMVRRVNIEIKQKFRRRAWSPSSRSMWGMTTSCWSMHSYILPRGYVSVTNNNGFWVGGLDLLTPSITTSLNHNPSRPALRSTQTPIQWVPEALFPGVKRPRREVNHSPPTNAEVKKIWIYTSTPIRLHGVVPN